MPPIALVIGAAVAIATIGTAILHISSSESNSSSTTDIPEKSNDTLKDKVEFFLLKKLLNGIVTIESKISSSEANEKQEQQERIESISSTLGSKATSIAMNAAQDIIAQLNNANTFDSVAETIASGVNDVTADYSTHEDATASFQAEQQNGTWIETVPAYEQEPWTETYPAPENTEPQIESFPAIQDEAPTITVFPHAKPEIPSIETIPAETPKELGDNILWNSGNKGVADAKYTTKIKWGINDIEARPFGKGFWGKRIPQKNTRVDDFELKINPNDESFYLPHPNGGYVQFENLAGDIVQDGKLIIKQKSFYHVEDLPKFAQNKVIQEAMRQIDSAKAAGYKVEWLVSEEKAVNQLTRLFERENIDITVKYYPE
ncbi:hypothetical protein [Clostridium saccharobutylicum]|uniref:Tox-REase-5 domain-containing protein n=1 Tax=Clostridium saccharobutylicum DSM 13864 TaxID=1345695 RepID=U5MYA1_CLOSA|nr:hypothetical protein [Clostridium saccharobutylicum]AGX44621.1 hypothetical protein CLSA_c36600 [Clostridium saccharobutylicum DSM 13864]AQR91911.1 hypothetical protein CLOSC_36390 [Clostridium saccharobutylicum]AQS01813.1 hypothetical protein CSACC_36440 [Clostridium saccharobutylicum]AQS15796.1 hypothetical protein CLOSACC_36440 [Clostridium saccharobutylicum]MBA2903398.1 hypothetical protein [Clostridium saccharobutylicum]